MKKFLFTLLACSLFLNTVPASAQDAFPVASARIVNAPDVRSWPATAAITSISVTPTNLRVDFTKRDGPNRWPDITPPGFTGPIEYTVWLFLQVDSQWVGSGFIQMWNGRDGVGDAPSDFAKNWYYSPRWNPLPSHGPIQPSDQIGIMVTSGNERDSGGPYSVQERSNVVLISGSDNADYAYQTAPPPPPVPTVIGSGCSGDPTSGNPATRQLVLALGTSIPSTASDAMLRMASALQAQGHAVSVMDNNGPSDHKAWIDGEAWTLRSSDAVRCPTITWSPYLQGAYDGSGFSACGIPNSAHLWCPSWFVAVQPAPVPVPPAPVPVPSPSPAPAPQPPPAPAPTPLNLDLTPVLARLDALVALETDTNTQITAMNRTIAQTLGAVMTFVGKYIAPAVTAYIAAKKLG